MTTKTTSTRTSMATHEFSLLLEGRDVLHDDVFDALDEPCHDAVVGHRGGLQFADFEREAPTFPEAVVSAIRDIESAVEGLRVVRVQPDELVTAAAIAKRVGRTPQNINQLARGARGSRDFPAPVAWVDGKTRLWRWSDVVVWFSRRGDDGSSDDLADAEFIAMLNGHLDARRHHGRLRALQRAQVPEAEQALAVAGAANELLRLEA